MADSPTTLRPQRKAGAIGLTLKLLAAFCLVTLVAATTVAVISSQSATREFKRFVRDTQYQPSGELIASLAEQYCQQGDWSGARELLTSASPTSDAEPWVPLLILVDDQGSIVASNWSSWYVDQITAQELAQGMPVMVEGQTVGTVVVPGNRPPPEDAERLSPTGVATLARVRWAITLAALGAGSAALLTAGVLTWGLVRPLRRLTSAAEGIARGDLSQRVPISGNDEVAELSDTFNRMAAELERAELVRRNMTADIAHELRTPLTVIRGRLEGVLDGIYPATTSHLQPILEQTELLTYLVEDLRTLAQAEAGQLDLDRQAVDVGELLQEAVLAFENQSAERRIRLSLEVPDGLPRVSADGRRLAQVLGNLLTNALRHTPEGGQVTISAAAARGAVRLAVTDTGTGIPADELPHVFDRFWRGDKSRSRAGGGVGLGLAIARQFIELHGGTIGAESTPGQGASFWFTLPVT